MVELVPVRAWHHGEGVAAVVFVEAARGTAGAGALREEGLVHAHGVVVVEVGLCWLLGLRR